ncbi:MAG: hypothetical protein LBH44_07060 [Treponema sp.]|jgi:hypothetical protein|nr:hypothetical protein [Treponema sp.]
MKTNRSLGIAGGVLALTVIFLVSCLNPIGFDPDKALATINVTGELGMRDVTSAVLMISNRSKTVDVTKFVITQPDDPGTRYDINGKPEHLTTKAQYVQPSDLEYKVNIFYIDYHDDKVNGQKGELTAIISAPIPKESYWLYLFRTKDGVVVFEKDFKPDVADGDDTGNPRIDPEDEGEGSIPGASNTDRLSVLVIINMTKSQDIDFVRFSNDSINSGITSDSPKYRMYTMNHEPKHGDQQSIALGPGSWKTEATYTSGGIQKVTESKNAIISVLGTSMAARTNFMYFYLTKSGNCNLTPIWPPIANDASDDNFDHILGENDGILEITNKSESGKFIRDLMIDTVEYKDIMMLKDDVMRFIMPAGTVNVAFRPQGQNYYGLNLPRIIKPKMTTTVSYYDNLGQNEELPADNGFGVSLIQINNNSNAVVKQIYIVNPNDPMGHKINKTANTFTPAKMINYHETGRVVVFGNADFPLQDNKIYLIQVELYGSTGIYYTEYYRAIYGLKVVIDIDSASLPISKSYGSKVTIENKLPANIGTVDVTGMQVYSTATPGQKSFYNSAMWTGGVGISNGKSASLYVVSSPEMPIVKDVTYKASIFLTGNGRTAVIEKTFYSDGLLYADIPDEHLRTITINQSDVPPELIEVFKPVTNVDGIPTEVTSKVLKGTSTLVGPGVINLRSITITPNDATNQLITWTKAGSNQSSYKIENDLLTVTEGKTAGSTTSIQITATIVKGGAGQANYTKTFNITLKYEETAPASNLATSLSSTKMDIYVGDTHSLLGRVVINPAAASKDGIPITVLNLTFAITSGTGATISGSNITATAEGTVKVTATLAAQYCNSGTALTTTFDVVIVTAGTGAIFHDVTGITLTTSTVTSIVMANTSNLISAGWFNLNVAEVNSDATVKKITWSTVSGDVSLIKTSELANGMLVVSSAPAVATSTVNKTVTLRATVVKGKTNNTVDYTKDFTFTLSFTTWTYTNKVTSIDLVTPAASGGDKMVIYEQDTKSLLGMVKLTVSGGGVAYNNGVPITVNDLEWYVKTRTAGGDISVVVSNKITGSNITGKTAGIVTIYAILPAAKNGGTQITMTVDITVTVWSTPLISNNAKAAFWFLFTAVYDGIAFVPCTEDNFTDTERLTGITTRTWAATDADFNKTNFLKKYPGAIIGGRSSGMGYTPGIAFEGQPRPMTYPDSGRYYVFFLKKETGKDDERVYGNGPATPSGNTLFLLDVKNKGPSIVLKNQSGSVTETAMWTSKITWNPALTGVIPESSCTITEKADSYYNNMGIPIGIYRFKFWSNKIEFTPGVFYN